MKEELAISQGFGIMKNLNKSTEETEEEKAGGEDDTNTKSGFSKFVCDRYPNIVAGRQTPTIIFSLTQKMTDFKKCFVTRNSAYSSLYSHKARGWGGGIRPRGFKSEVGGRPEFS